MFSELDELGKYQHIQFAKDVKMSLFTVRKVHVREKAEDIAHISVRLKGQSILSQKRLLEQINCVIFISCCLPRCKPKLEMGSPGKFCKGTFCLMEWIPRHTGDPQSYWQFNTSRSTGAWTKRHTKDMKWKKKAVDPPNAAEEKYVDEPAQLQSVLSVMKKEYLS